MSAVSDYRHLWFLLLSTVWCVCIFVAARGAAKRWGERNLLRRIAETLCWLPLVSVIASWTLFSRIRLRFGEWPFWDSNFGIAENGLSGYNPQHHGDPFPLHFSAAQFLAIMTYLSVLALGPCFAGAALESARFRRSALLYAVLIVLAISLRIIDPGEMMNWLTN